MSTLSYASKIGYRNTVDQLFTYFGRDRGVRDIQRRHAEAFIATRKRCDGRHGELSSWSRARHLIHCRAIFAAAVEWGYADANPFQAPKTSGNSPLHIRPKGRPWHHITPDEFMPFVAVVTSARQRAACWLMYGCGLRPGEVYNITVGNIDLHARRVHVVNRAATADLPPFAASSRSGESSAICNIVVPSAM